MQFKSQAIILKRIAYGEADLIVTFFSRDRGRQSGIARSARRSIRRFGGALEPGTLVEISFTKRKGSELARIDEAAAIRSSTGLRRSLERMQSVSRALGLALAFLQESVVAIDKFDLLNSRLEYLSGTDPHFSDSVAFEIAWLKFTGFGPHLGGCTSCGLESAGHGWVFDFERGGLFCPACVVGAGERIPLTGPAVGYLKSVHRGDVPHSHEGALLAGRVLGGYVDHVLGRPLRAGIYQ